jgi:uncharacterized membrane protein
MDKFKTLTESRNKEIKFKVFNLLITFTIVIIASYFNSYVSTIINIVSFICFIIISRSICELIQRTEIELKCYEKTSTDSNIDDEYQQFRNRIIKLANKRSDNSNSDIGWFSGIGGGIGGGGGCD